MNSKLNKVKKEFMKTAKQGDVLNVSTELYLDIENMVEVGEKYPKGRELLTEILDVIHEYDGTMPLVSVIGVLELAKLDLINKGDSYD